MTKKHTTEKPEDRRVQKTKKLLSDALVSLIVKKGYPNVSIKDIIDTANVGRSTFYSHFENKEQLLLSGHVTFKTLLGNTIPRRKKKPQSADLNFLYLYQHVQEQRPLANALIGKQGGEIVADHLHSIIAQRIEEYYGAGIPRGKELGMFRFTVHAAATAMVQLIVQWVTHGMTFTPEEMTEKSESLLRNMMGN
ncbi:MAG: TetR/AcrR family transcriptional regulator [Bacteroidota bacterium]